MKLGEAVGFYLSDIQVSHAQTTIRLYSLLLPHLIEYLGNPELEEITGRDLQRYMIYMTSEYIPNRSGGDTSPLSPSTVDKHWTALRSFFGWAEEVLGVVRPDLKLKRPQYQLPERPSFSEEEIRHIMYYCKYSVEVQREGQRPFRMKRPTANRDRAIVLLFLDTGLRMSEVCRLKVEDVNLDTGEVYVTPFGGGQKTKPRIVYLGQTAKRALWIYLLERKEQQPYYPNDHLIEIRAHTISSMLRRLGERAGTKVHAHKFRHTFAIQYLRNGGDVFTLQRLLGHSTLDMVRHYLNLANTDIQNAHRKASPADRWRL